MNTGPRTQAAFIQGHQSTMEHDTSHSALFYLFQEVSKLASPIHNSFLDTNPSSMWLNETSGKGPFIFKKEEEDVHSFQVSNSSCQQSLFCMSPPNQMKKVKGSYSSKVMTLGGPQSQSECNSPWKVLSLINLQCERLLHHSDVEESDPSSVSSATTLSHPTEKALNTTADVRDQGVRGDCISDQSPLRSSILTNEREEVPACVSHVEDERVCSAGASSLKSQCFVKDSRVGCCVQSQKADTVRPELTEENAIVTSQPQNTDKREDKFSVNRQFEWTQEYNKDCFSSEQDILNVPFSENGLSESQILNASLLAFNSKEDASKALSKPALTLDCNANHVLTTGPPCDTQLRPTSSVLSSSQSASLLYSIAETSHSLLKQDDKIITSELECTQVPIEGLSHPVAQLKYSSYKGETNPSPPISTKLEPMPVQRGETAHPSAKQWRTKTPRKQPHPSRSADIRDPAFRGVTFRMDTELDDSREQCRLLITSKYSKELRKSIRKPRLKKQPSQKFLQTSSSDEESDPTTSVSKGKVCASCSTRKTPMWRDAEDGTPLCNACGIRYKKYRVRCVNCWHIPRKESNSNSCCLKCGNFVRLTSAQRNHTT